MTTIDVSVLRLDHPYQKDAKAFIKGIKKREVLIQQQKELAKHVLAKFDVKSEYDVPSEYWTSLEWVCSPQKAARRKLSSTHLRLNRRLDKLKFGYWACFPKGTTEYYAIYPQLRQR